MGYCREIANKRSLFFFPIAKGNKRRSRSTRNVALASVMSTQSILRVIVGDRRVNGRIFLDWQGNMLDFPGCLSVDPRQEVKIGFDITDTHSLFVFFLFFLHLFLHLFHVWSSHSFSQPSLPFGCVTADSYMLQIVAK